MTVPYEKVKFKIDFYTLIATVVGLTLSASGYFYVDFPSKPIWVKLSLLLIVVLILGIMILIRYFWLVFQHRYEILIENNLILRNLKNDVSGFNDFTTGFYKNFIPNNLNPPSPLIAKTLGNKIIIECRGKAKDGTILRLFKSDSGNLIGTFIVLGINGDHFRAMEAELTDEAWASSVKVNEIELSAYTLIPIPEES